MVWETSNISIQFILTLILTLRYRLGKSRCRRSIWDGNLLKSTSCFICRRYILFHTKVVKVEMKVNQLDSLDLKMVIIEFGMCLLRILLTLRANDSDWSVGWWKKTWWTKSQFLRSVLVTRTNNDKKSIFDIGDWLSETISTYILILLALLQTIEIRKVQKFFTYSPVKKKINYHHQLLVYTIALFGYSSDMNILFNCVLRLWPRSQLIFLIILSCSLQMTWRKKVSLHCV